MTTELWTDRYRPTSVKEIVGQKDGIKKLCNWLDSYEEGDLDNKRCVLISGDSGIGKTSSAICILEERGYQIYEFNASDVRTKGEIEDSLFRLIRVKQVKGGKPVAVIMDEIDGMDKGALEEIIKYINPDRGKGNRRKEDREKRLPLPPMICICNNGADRKLLNFHKDCLSLTFKKPNKEELKLLLRRVCAKESIKLDEDAEDLVIEYAQGDYRRLLNYLQSLDSLIINHDQVLEASNIEECNYVIGEKTMDMGLEESVHYLLKTPSLTPKECLRVYSNNKSQIVCCLYENYGYIIDGKKGLTGLEKAEKKSRVVRDIAKSDMIDKIMHKNQLWYLHTDHGLLSCYLPITELACDNPMLHTASSRSKFNQQKNNEKDIYHLSSKLKSVTGTVDVHILSQLALHFLLDQPAQITADKSLPNDVRDARIKQSFEDGMRFLHQYGLSEKDVKTLIKIDRLSTHAKGGHKFNKQLKAEYEDKSSESSK